MMRMIGVALIAAVVGVAIGISGTLLLHSSSAATPQPDRIVGIVMRCTVGANGKTIDIEGDQCAEGNRNFQGAVIVNSRSELTIRTDKGTTYNIDVPISTHVNVGDPWPEP